jgi:hypothetical protein
VPSGTSGTSSGFGGRTPAGPLEFSDPSWFDTLGGGSAGPLASEAAASPPRPAYINSPENGRIGGAPTSGTLYKSGRLGPTESSWRRKPPS